MLPRLQPIVRWAHHRRVAVLAGAVLVAAIAGMGLRGLRFDADVLGLLPQSGSAVGAFRAFLERFGTLDDLYVVFTAPDGYSIADYEEAIDAWSDALATTPEISRVDRGTIDASRDWSWLGDHQLLLLDDDHLSEALGRMTPEGLPQALAASRELLAAPSPEITTLVRDDPLGFHALLQRQMSAKQFGSALVMTGGGYVSADGRRRLIVAKPVRPPYDTDFSHQLLDRLESIARWQAAAPAADEDPLPPLEVAFAGGHRIATEAEAVVKRESIVNGIGSLALILPLLWMVFGSARLMVIGALPSMLSILIVLGVLGYSGATLSAAAAGSAAMLFGLGVDGVVLLYVAYCLAAAETQDPGSAIARLSGPAASMVLGMWTTGATFLGLMVVDFPSLEQLGLLIGASMLVCGIATLFLVPAMLPARLDRTAMRDVRLPALAAAVTSRSRGILAAALVITLVLSAGAVRLRIDPTLDRLRSVTPGAQLLADVTHTFGLPSDVMVILQEGRDLDGLLAANAAFVTAAQRAVPSLAVQAPSALLPSSTTQAARQARVRAHLPPPNRFRAEFAAAAGAAGFVPASFEPFLQRVERMRNAELLTYDAITARGMDDLVIRSVAKIGDGWMLATYTFPQDEAQRATLTSLVEASKGAMVASGMALVNRELGDQFLPQFLRGATVGSLIVLVLMLISFRDWRYVLLALTPTLIGLVWAAGILGYAGVELDLFAVFAVMTFVGIGVDYGIHLIHRYREHRDALRVTSELAPVILVAGAITLLGYGTLISSSYPPLRSIGMVSIVSVVGMVAASVLVLPALLHWSKP